MRSLRLVLLLLLLLLPIGCESGGGSVSSGGEEPASSGSIAFRMGSPSQQTVAQIVSVQVEVVSPATGAQLLPAKTLTFGQEVVFSNVPVGLQLVRAQGFDAGGNVVASNEVSVQVLPGQLSRASLVLTPSTIPDEPVVPPNDNPPTQLAFTSNPPATVSGDFSVTVEVRDAQGNRVTTATNAVTLSLVSPGSATLNGTTTVNAVNGLAVFTGLSVSEPGNFTLQAAATGLTSATSTSFDVTVDVALYAVTIPGGAGTPFATLVELDPDTGEFVGSFGRLNSPSIAPIAVQGMFSLPDGTMYATVRDQFNNQDSFLLRINPLDPENSTVIGMSASNSPDNDFIQSVTYDSNSDTVWALLQDGSAGFDQLGTLSLTTGAFSPLPNNTGVPIAGGGRGMAFDATTSTLYLTDGVANLYTLDTTTGVATLVGNVTNFGDTTIRALAVNPADNEIYGITRLGVTPGLWSGLFGTLDKSTGAATVVERTVLNATAMCFVPNPTLPTAGPVEQTDFTFSVIPSNFTDISGTGTDLGSSDINVPIGFTFNFNGSNFTNLRVLEDYATFDMFDTGALPNNVLPTAQALLRDGALLPWADTYTSAGPGRSRHRQTLGTAPNRRLIVQWVVDQDVGPTGNTISFQLVLHETTNVIEFFYGDVDAGNPDLNAGNSGLIGIQVNETTAHMVSIFEPILTTTEGFRFTPGP